MKFLLWPNRIKKAHHDFIQTASYGSTLMKAQGSPVVKQRQKLFLGEAGSTPVLAILVSNTNTSFC